MVLVMCEPTPTGRKETAARIAGETSGVIIHPYDDYSVMAGQGTIGLELMEQVLTLVTQLWRYICLDSRFHLGS